MPELFAPLHWQDYASIVLHRAGVPLHLTSSFSSGGFKWVIATMVGWWLAYVIFLDVTEKPMSFEEIEQSVSARAQVENRIKELLHGLAIDRT